MSADPILYCLEHLTDYRQFERLATDLMANTEYPGIEPNGGTADGGRDALFIRQETGAVTVFAYSVRIDWTDKLQEDCSRIAELDLSPTEVVFVSSQTISAPQKDKHRTAVDQRYGWALTYYDVERIRALLGGPLNALLGQHP